VSTGRYELNFYKLFRLNSDFKVLRQLYGRYVIESLEKCISTSSHQKEWGTGKREREKEVLFLMVRWLFPRISPQALKEGQYFACTYISLCPSWIRLNLFVSVVG